MRTAIELIHIVAGLIVAWTFTELAIWAYPLGTQVIWWCGAAGMAAAVVMGAGPLLRAWRLDRRFAPRRRA